MVFLEDPITAEGVSRTTLEEEEEQAEALVDQYSVAPTVEWTGEPVHADVAVFLIGQAASLLAGTHLRRGAAAGEVALPELRRLRSPYEEEYGLEHTDYHRTALTRPSGSVVLVEAGPGLASEQACTWAEGVLGALRPRRVVLVTAIPAGSYRGEGSPADEDLVFSIRTSAAQPAAAGLLPAELPPGTLVDGLAAAVFSLCELAGTPATAVIGVQMAPVPDGRFVGSLGQAAGAALGAEGCRDVLVEQSHAQLVAAVSAATECIFRSSAANSIFA